MKNIRREDIEKLLSENVPDLRDKSIYIYGGGNTAQLYQEGLRREFFYEQIKGYCNSNPDSWGTKVFGKECVNPESLVNKDMICVLI